MNLFFRAIGYSDISSQADIDELVSKSIKPENIVAKIKLPNSDIELVEYIKIVDVRAGVIIYCEKKNGRLWPVIVVPIVTAEYVNEEKDLTVDHKVEGPGMSVMCEDDRFGMSLIAYVQNQIDVLKIYGDKEHLGEAAIAFGGLSTKGTIILPSYIPEKEREKIKLEKMTKNKLMGEARNGNANAIDDLSLSDIDRYADITKRCKNEDILTIVETSFCPNGTESDNYNIIGIIDYCRESENSETKEKMWFMNLMVNGMKISILINKKDLIGEPAVGRRFKGSIWLQGEIRPIEDPDFGRTNY